MAGQFSAMHSYKHLNFDFSINIAMTNEIWSSINKHTSLYVLSLLFLYTNTRVGFFKNKDIIYKISVLSYIRKDI